MLMCLWKGNAGAREVQRPNNTVLKSGLAHLHVYYLGSAIPLFYAAALEFSSPEGIKISHTWPNSYSGHSSPQAHHL